MKKVVVLGISIFLLLIGYKAEAKDTMYSLNKYKEEYLEYILKSYKEEKIDGYVVAGTSKKEKEKQVIVLKYEKNGKLNWEYNYAKEGNNELEGITYRYNEKKEMDGYLLVIRNTTEEKHYLVEMTLDGTTEEEHSLSLEKESTIEKIVSNEKDYVFIGQKNDVAFLTKYDKNFNEVWTKTYQKENVKTSMKDILYYEEVGYFGLVEIETDKEKSYELVKWDINGDFQKVLKSDFEKEDDPHLEKEKDAYILYGITQEVKLSEKDSRSFYVKKYNLEGVEEWETIGDTSIHQEEVLKLQPVLEEGKEIKYYILIKNSSDDSYEVIQMNIEGLIEKKIKKIKNDYYRMNDFQIDGSNIYFAGQIDCPEEDNCDYHKNALFLISDEDKVIEVKASDSKVVLIVTSIAICGVIVVYLIRKRKELQNKKKKH